ncbi:MAG: DUF3987 domain-containing protein [Chloroflexi bacterium]|nr:DUF3987 domain-containing protein [Chloroflexota bacterium]
MAPLAEGVASIGNQQYVELKRGFIQYPQIWVVTVAPPGAAKSPTDDAARGPLDELQAIAMSVY